MRCSLRFLVLVLVVTAISGDLFAQRIDTIYANPQAQPLRKVWEVGGRRDDGMSVGGCTILTDSSVVWYVGGSQTCAQCGWYRWDRAGDSVQQFQGLMPGGGCTGRFFGTEERYLATSTAIQYTPDVYAPRLVLMRYVDSAFDTTVITEWNGAQQDSVDITFPIGMTATDLDNDGADELIVLYPARLHPVFDSTGQLIGASGELRPHLRIWRGGSHFNLDTPTLVIKDSLFKSTNAVLNRLIVGRFDNDELPDVATIFEYRINGHDSTLFSVWMNRGNPWEWGDPTTRVEFPDAHVADLGRTLVLHDADGDGQLDCLYPIEPFSLGQHAQFLSRTGGSFLQRLDSTGALRTTRADRMLKNTEFDGAFDWGYISDSTERYAMLGFLRRGSYVGLSGGPNGPDASWDATGSGLSNPVPAGDATGDGWGDLLVSYPFSGANQGYAALYAGGPYIPHDPTVGVEWTAIAGEHSRAVAIWPNPATELVHIAWRGDLRSMPRSFRIHDATATLVAEGSVSAGRGEVLWNCSAWPSGTYTCSISDAMGATIAVTRVLVQH